MSLTTDPRAPELLMWTRQANIEKVQEMISEGTSTLAANAFGWLPIHVAVEAKDLELVTVLLSAPDSSVALNARSHANLTALHFAVMANAPNIVKLLCDAGAPLEAAAPLTGLGNVCAASPTTRACPAAHAIPPL